MTGVYRVGKLFSNTAFGGADDLDKLGGLWVDDVVYFRQTDQILKGGKMPKDTLVFGSLAGIIGNIFKEVLTWVFYGLGMLKFTFVHLCSGMVVNPEYVKSPLGLTLGFLIDYTLAATFGIVIYALLKRTGACFIVLKGLFFGIVIFLICYSMIRPIFSSIKGNTDPLTVLLYLLPNFIYGITTSLFIKKYDTSVKK